VKEKWSGPTFKPVGEAWQDQGAAVKKMDDPAQRREAASTLSLCEIYRSDRYKNRRERDVEQILRQGGHFLVRIGQ